MGHTAMHKDMIQEYVDKGWEKNGFKKKLKEALKEFDWYEDVEVNFMPDAFRIDAENREVLLCEVVCSHDIKPNKMRRLSEFWDVLDFYEWDVRLFVRTKYGELEHALTEEWYNTLGVTK